MAGLLPGGAANSFQYILPLPAELTLLTLTDTHTHKTLFTVQKHIIVPDPNINEFAAAAGTADAIGQPAAFCPDYHGNETGYSGNSTMKNDLENEVNEKKR